MQRTVIDLPTDSGDAESKPSFNVVIAYEDFETGKRAKNTHNFLVEHLENDCWLSNQMWKFDVLSIPKLREMAVRDARAADIILVSCRGDSELPEHVTQWIEAWLAEKENPIALVALFDCEPWQSLPIRAYLASVARRGGMEFFAQPDDWFGGERAPQAGACHTLPELRVRTLTTLAGATQCDFSPRWEVKD